MVTLRELRVRRRMEMEEVAEAVGVSKSLIYRCEAGLGAPRFRTQRKIAEFFGVDPNEIEYGVKTTTGPGGRPRRKTDQAEDGGDEEEERCRAA